MLAMRPAHSKSMSPDTPPSKLHPHFSGRRIAKIRRVALAEMTWRDEPAGHCDLYDGQPGVLQQPPGFRDPKFKVIAQWRRPQLRPEQPLDLTPGQVDSTRHLLQIQRFLQIGLHQLDDLA